MHQLNWIGSGKREGLHIEKIHFDITMLSSIYFLLKLNQSNDFSMNSITDQPLLSE